MRATWQRLQVIPGTVLPGSKAKKKAKKDESDNPFAVHIAAMNWQ